MLPYIDLGVTDIQHVPIRDDGISAPIHVNFPFGHQVQSTVYVSLLTINVMLTTSSLCIYNR